MKTNKISCSNTITRVASVIFSLYLRSELLSCNSFHYENAALLSTRILRQHMPTGAQIILTRNKQSRIQLLWGFSELTPALQQMSNGNGKHNNSHVSGLRCASSASFSSHHLKKGPVAFGTARTFGLWLGTSSVIPGAVDLMGWPWPAQETVRSVRLLKVSQSIEKFIEEWMELYSYFTTVAQDSQDICLQSE